MIKLALFFPILFISINQLIEINVTSIFVKGLTTMGFHIFVILNSMAISKFKRRSKSTTFQPIRLAVSVGVCLATGFVGSLVTTPTISSWYRYLNQPVLAPPNWIFAPVWTILYILMGISLYLAWIHRARLTWFWVQLGLNANWPLAFFGLRSPKLGLLNIIVLWLSIVLTIRDFRRKSAFAAWLLVPYLIWVSFATYLNWTIWRLN